MGLVPGTLSVVFQATDAGIRCSPHVVRSGKRGTGSIIPMQSGAGHPIPQWNPLPNQVVRRGRFPCLSVSRRRWIMLDLDLVSLIIGFSFGLLCGIVLMIRTGR